MIVIVDFGSQTTHLIARRIKEFGIKTEIVLPDGALKKIQHLKPSGIILSGGPSSVYENDAPTVDKKIFDLKIPLLAICYGFQLIVKLLGGKVESGKKEYGPATLAISKHDESHSGDEQSEDSKIRFWASQNDGIIARGLPKQFTVWMNHGDEVLSIPKGFEILGSTPHILPAFVQNSDKKIVGVLFHPEVDHTEFGTEILKNFVEICNLKTSVHKIDINAIKQFIKQTVGDNYVIGAVSGGVDSTVAAVLTADAVGERFIPIYVNNGLMRQGTEEQVKKIFQHHHVKPIIIDGVEETLRKLKQIKDPETKRKIIGKMYIDLFETEMAKLVSCGKNVTFLMQGTIYSDVIESQGSKHSDKIKSHHNVGGLPQNMKLKLLEPLRNFYKDEVREIGKQLGLADEFIWKQVFPGPGYAVRIRGEVTKERLEKIKLADAIILEELEKAGVLKNLFMSFPVMTGADSVAVKGDGRFFGEVIAIRIIESNDVMTANWARLPYDLLQKISSRIVNEVPRISRVVYDITTKPPATMEWE